MIFRTEASLLIPITSRSPNFRARLRGDNEVPTVITETRGKVKLKFDDDLTRVMFRIKLRDGIRVTQAHLHCAPYG